MIRYFSLLIFLITFVVNVSAQSEQEQLAVQYYQNQEYEKAADLFKELYKEDPSVSFYKYYLGCLVELEDYSEAKKLVRKQKRNSDFPLKYEVELGYLLQQEGNDRKAKRKFKDAIREVPNQRQAYIDLANAFVNRKLHDYAIDLLKRGNRKINSDRAFHMDLASLYGETKQYRKMMEQYLELLNNNPDYTRQIKDELQLFIEDGEEEKLSTIKNVLLEQSQKSHSNSLYAELLMWYSIQLKDFDIALKQAKALDKRFNEDGKRVFYLAKVLADNKKYDLAIDAYQYVINKGEEHSLYLGSLIRLLDVKFDKLTRTGDYNRKDLLTLEGEYKHTLETLGENASTIELMLNMAHMQAFYMDKVEDARKLLNKAIDISRAKPKQIAKCKIKLADILVMDGDVWEATLLYQQVDKDFKNEPLGHKAKLKDARLSFYMGEFQWASSQLDVLKAATSKLIANDALQLYMLIKDNIGLDSSLAAIKTYARAEMYAFQRKTDLALKTLDSLQLKFMGHNIQDEVLFKKAEIQINKKNYEKADDLLADIVKNYNQDILADDALMKRAELNEFYLKNKEKAKSLYQKIITDYPGSLYTVKARKRYRILRGDDIGSERDKEIFNIDIMP
ncbi:MAG: tetratricopeptide repeat protein [Bacteroidales bacterium]